MVHFHILCQSSFCSSRILTAFLFLCKVHLISTNVCPAGTLSDTLYSGDALSPNQGLLSANGLWALIYQDQDGDLCGYPTIDAAYFGSFWCSGTTNYFVGDVRLTTQGNLQILNSDGKLVWSANNTGSASSSFLLVMQNDRNLVLYRQQIGVANVVWQTNTAVDLTQVLGEKQKAA